MGEFYDTDACGPWEPPFVDLFGQGEWPEMACTAGDPPPGPLPLRVRVAGAWHALRAGWRTGVAEVGRAWRCYGYMARGGHADRCPD